MRVIVTGAGGFVGRVVARHLGRSGYGVTAICRKSVPSDLPDVPGVTLLKGDLRAIGPLPGADGLVHCAADVPAFCPREDELFRSNVEGTRALFAAAHAAGVRRVVYLSSMAVYGSISTAAVDENLPIDRPDNYGRSKLEGERMLKELCGHDPEVRGVAIRLPGVVGAGARNNFLANTLGRILRGEPVRALHADALFNNVIHVDDLAEFILDRLGAMTRGFAVTNIASREALRMRDVVGLLYDAAGRPDDAQWGVDSRQPFTISLVRVEAQGYVPRTVRDTLQRYVRDEMIMQSEDPAISGCNGQKRTGRVSRVTRG
jgi:dihydroflavonol-4-reductase